MRAYAQRHYGIDEFRLRRPRVIVEHYTATDTLAPVFNTFATDSPDVELGELPGVCAHFVIDRDGTVYGLVPTTIMCRHTVGLNWTAIGIEHVGTSDGQVLGNRAPAARLAAADAVAPGPLRHPHPQRDRARREPLEPATTASASPGCARQTHGDMARAARWTATGGGSISLPAAGQHALTSPAEPEHGDVRHGAPGVTGRTRDEPGRTVARPDRGARRRHTAHAIFSAGMATALKTTTTELGESRVRLEVEVPSDASSASSRRPPRPSGAR